MRGLLVSAVRRALEGAGCHATRTLSLSLGRPTAAIWPSMAGSQPGELFVSSRVACIAGVAALATTYLFHLWEPRCFRRSSGCRQRYVRCDVGDDNLAIVPFDPSYPRLRRDTDPPFRDVIKQRKEPEWLELLRAALFFAAWCRQQYIRYNAEDENPTWAKFVWWSLRRQVEAVRRFYRELKLEEELNKKQRMYWLIFSAACGFAALAVWKAGSLIKNKMESKKLKEARHQKDEELKDLRTRK